MAKLSRKAFLAELDRISPDLRKAFLQAIEDVKSTAQLSAIEGAIERGDVEGAINALRLGPDFFAPLDDAIGKAFRAGAIWQLSGLPKKTLPTGSPILAVRFQGRHPRAEAWVRESSSTLIRKIYGEQRSMIRSVIEKGLAEGRNPRRTALDIIGRRDKVTGQRKGGLVGLTMKQSEWVENMRTELLTPNLSGGYFNRKRRDRRFDSLVRRSIAEGKPLTDTQIAKITGRYSDRLLQLRGETIARTETLRALNAGRDEGVNQIIDTGEINADQIDETWDATEDVKGGRTRDSHVDMDGQTVKHGEAFTTPSGAQMMFPGDTSLGAPAEEVIQCRCYKSIKIDFLAGLR